MTGCCPPGWGTAAANLILNKQYGNMVGLVNGEIVPVPLEEVAGKLKTRSARQLHHQRGQKHRHQLRRLRLFAAQSRNRHVYRQQTPPL